MTQTYINQNNQTHTNIKEFKNVVKITPQTNSVVATNEEELLVAELDNLDKHIKALQKTYKAKRELIEKKMGDKEILLNKNGLELVTWKIGKDRETFKTKEFKEEYPGLYEQFVKFTKVRNFLIK